MADNQTPTEAFLLSTSPDASLTNQPAQVPNMANGDAVQEAKATAAEAVSSVVEPVKDAARRLSRSEQVNGAINAAKDTAAQAASSIQESVSQIPPPDPYHSTALSALKDAATSAAVATQDTVHEAATQIPPPDPYHSSTPAAIKDTTTSAATTAKDTLQEAVSQIPPLDPYHSTVASSVKDNAVAATSVAADQVEEAAAAVTANGSSYAEEDETPLFSPTLISAEVAAALPEGYTIRPLRCSDYHRGFLDTLRVLTTVGTPSYSAFSSQYQSLLPAPGRHQTYHILVILDSSSTIVGTGAVIVERKFIHDMGLVGHIEDIAVAKNQQGKKLGLRIIQALDSVAKAVGCYKCILDCSEANEGFYVKCGFKRAGLEMAHYYGVAG